MNNLQLASTNELLEELMARSDNLVMCMRTERTDEDGVILTRLKGDKFACVGLADFLLERAKEFAEDTVYAIDDSDLDDLANEFESDP